MPANEHSASCCLSLSNSRSSEEFRSGQKIQTFDFESAAYANFATPAATSTQPNILQINASTASALRALRPACPISMQVTVAPTRATRPTCPRGACSARNVWLISWVMFCIATSELWCGASSLGPSMSRSSAQPLPSRHKRLNRRGACKRLKHGCDPIRLRTSLAAIESILETILFARFENCCC
jgi:hypothetical protein